jgi:hypothetical protein
MTTGAIAVTAGCGGITRPSCSLPARPPRKFRSLSRQRRRTRASPLQRTLATPVPTLAASRLRSPTPRLTVPSFLNHQPIPAATPTSTPSRSESAPSASSSATAATRVGGARAHSARALTLPLFIASILASQGWPRGGRLRGAGAGEARCQRRRWCGRVPCVPRVGEESPPWRLG